MENYNLEKDIASDLKEQFELEQKTQPTCRRWFVSVRVEFLFVACSEAFQNEKFLLRYGPTWHCLVGRHFSSYARCPAPSMPDNGVWCPVPFQVTHEKSCYCDLSRRRDRHDRRLNVISI